jgi:protein TonB
MSSFVQALPADSNSLSGISAPARGRRRPIFVVATSPDNARSLLVAVLTTSACAHLLIVGYLGYGIPSDLPRLKPAPAAPAPVKVIEDVRLEALPPSPPPPKTLREVLPEPPATAPEVEPVAAIAAVPATVRLDFAIQPTGPVLVVNSIGQAAARAEPIPEAPVSLDSGNAKGNLLSPPMIYPPEALRRRLSGTVTLEFMTNSKGDIYGARVRESSGHRILDQDALDKLRQSRWTGEAGHFTKLYDYTLTFR